MAYQKQWQGAPFKNTNHYPEQHKKKHSGATLHTSFADKETGEVIDGLFITAWNYSKSRGLLSIIASPRRDLDKRKTKNKKYENWSVKVFNKRTLQTNWHNGFFDVVKKRLIVKDMEFVINPKAKNGGYCGTFVKS